MNTQVTHVPYQSIPAMLTDMLAGRIQLAFVAPSAALSFVTERRLKALAMVGSKRSSAMPEVPSALEAGMPAFDMVTWYGLLAPRGTPDPVLQRLHGALSQTMRDSEIHKKLTESGAEVVTDESPAAFKAYVDRDVEYWRDIVRDIKRGHASGQCAYLGLLPLIPVARISMNGRIFENIAQRRNSDYAPPKSRERNLWEDPHVDLSPGKGRCCGAHSRHDGRSGNCRRLHHEDWLCDN